MSDTKRTVESKDSVFQEAYNLPKRDRVNLFITKFRNLGYSNPDSMRRSYDRWVEKHELEKPIEIKDKPHHAKVLVMDIETAPLSTAVFGIWNQNIGLNQLNTLDYFIITWAAKWLFEDEVMYGQLTPEESLNENDERIVKDMWSLLEEADIVITHNGDKFDFKRLNTRFIIHGMNPPAPYQSIDTLKVVKKNFNFVSNKLNFINEVLGLETKLQHDGFSLWKGCVNGDQQSLDTMLEYNKQDVYIQEELYFRLRPWIKPHPNLGFFIEQDIQVCPNCASPDWNLIDNYYRTQLNEYQSFRCNCCGATGRVRKSSTPKMVKDNLLVSISK